MLEWISRCHTRTCRWLSSYVVGISDTAGFQWRWFKNHVVEIITCNCL